MGHECLMASLIGNIETCSGLCTPYDGQQFITWRTCGALVKLLLRANHSSVVKLNSVSKKYKGMLNRLYCFNSIIKIGVWDGQPHTVLCSQNTAGGLRKVIPHPQYTIDSARIIQFKVVSGGYEFLAACCHGASHSCMHLCSILSIYAQSQHRFCITNFLTNVSNINLSFCCN